MSINRLPPSTTHYSADILPSSKSNRGELATQQDNITDHRTHHASGKLIDFSQANSAHHSFSTNMLQTLLTGDSQTELPAHSIAHNDSSDHSIATLFKRQHTLTLDNSQNQTWPDPCSASLSMRFFEEVSDQDTATTHELFKAFQEQLKNRAEAKGYTSLAQVTADEQIFSESLEAARKTLP